MTIPWRCEVFVGTNEIIKCSGKSNRIRTNHPLDTSIYQSTEDIFFNLLIQLYNVIMYLSRYRWIYFGSYIDEINTYLIQNVGVFKKKFNYKKDGEGNNTKPHIYEKIYLEEKKYV